MGSSESPSQSPSVSPSISPSVSPSISPSVSPSVSPSQSPSRSPSQSPSVSPSISPSQSPSLSPSASESPSDSPSVSPSAANAAPTTVTGSVASVVYGVYRATFPIANHAGQVNLELDFVVGDSTGVTISPVEFYDPLTADWVKVPASTASGQTLAAYTLTIDADGKYTIPFIDLSYGFEKMRVTFSWADGTTSTLAADVSIS